MKTHASAIKIYTEKFFLSFCMIWLTSITLSQPVINSFLPTSGTIGTTVTITGKNFSATTEENIVYFGAVKANIISSVIDKLVVTVPPGATFQPISVTVNNLTGYSSMPFTVTFPGTHKIDSSIFTQQNFGSGYLDYIAVADLDGDGRSDVVKTDYGDTTISFFQNLSVPGSVDLKHLYDLKPTEPPAIVISDIDGDGKKDIVINEPHANLMSVYRNISTPGNFLFEGKVDFSTGNSGLIIGADNITAADVNNDGRTDVIVTIPLEGNVAVFKNTSQPGNISFDSPVNFTAGKSPYKIVAQDIDGDGKPELIVSKAYLVDSLSVFLNTSTNNNISFAAKQDFQTEKWPLFFSVGDLDNDGKADIVACDVSDKVNKISILKNISLEGILAFNKHVDVDFFEGVTPETVCIGDIDGDGKLDVVLTTSDLTIDVLKNISTGGSIKFGHPVLFGLNVEGLSPTLADIDLDNKPDILVKNSVSTSPPLAVFRSTNFPSLESFAPTQATEGTPVTIHGYNFKSASAVFFGDSAARSFIVLNDTTILATVGFGNSGKVFVHSPDGTDSLDGFVYIPTVLAVNLLNFSGNIVGHQVQLSWNGTQATDIDTFFIERSGNNTVYSTIGFLSGKSNISIFNFNDNSPLYNNNYYRLKIKNTDGNFYFGNVILEKFRESSITLYPNPADDFIIVAGLDAMKPSNIILYNSQGKLLYKKEVKNNVERIDIRRLKQGTYIIKVISKTNFIILKFNKLSNK